MNRQTILYCAMIPLIFFQGCASDFEKGKEAYDNGNWGKAVEHLSKIGKGYGEYNIAQSLLDESLFNYSKKINTVPTILNYLQSFPEGKHSEEALKIKEALYSKAYDLQVEFEQKQSEFNKQYQDDNNDIRKSNLFNSANRWSARFMKEFVSDIGIVVLQGRLASLSTKKGGKFDTFHLRLRRRDSL